MQGSTQKYMVFASMNNDGIKGTSMIKEKDGITSGTEEYAS